MGLSDGAIVGITLGVVGSLVIILGLFCFQRPKRTMKDPFTLSVELEDQAVRGHKDGEPSSPAEYVPSKFRIGLMSITSGKGGKREPRRVPISRRQEGSEGTRAARDDSVDTAPPRYEERLPEAVVTESSL